MNVKKIIKKIDDTEYNTRLKEYKKFDNPADIKYEIISIVIIKRKIKSMCNTYMEDRDRHKLLIDYYI